MADVWRPDLAKRFYGYVAAGGSAGAITRPADRVGAGARDRAGAAHRHGLRVHHGLGAARLTGAPFAAPRAGRPARCRMRPSRSAAARVDDLGAWSRSPYLLGIAGIIIAGQIIGGFMYNEQGKLVAAALSLAGRSRRRCSRAWSSTSTCCRWSSRRWSSPGSRGAAACCSACRPCRW